MNGWFAFDGHRWTRSDGFTDEQVEQVERLIKRLRGRLVQRIIYHIGRDRASRVFHQTYPLLVGDCRVYDN